MAKKRLGRGLNSLMPEFQNPQETEYEEYGRTLSVSKLLPNPDQPRKQFREERLQELAQSIRERGVIQPIIASKQNDESYIIIAGERRYRAAIMAGLNEIPVIVKTFTMEERLEIGLIENVQREDLNVIEEALGYRTLMDTFNYTQEDIAKKIGKSRSAIANALRLLRLPEEIQQGLQGQRISAGHARALLAIESDYSEYMGVLYARILNEGLSVRATEKAVQSINSEQGNKVLLEKQQSPSAATINQKQKIPEIIEMEDLLRQAWGTKVEVKGSEDKGKIEIQYFSKDDLSRLYDIFLGD